MSPQLEEIPQHIWLKIKHRVPCVQTQSARCLKVVNKVVNRADVFFNRNGFQGIKISERMGPCQKEINEIQR